MKRQTNGTNNGNSGSISKNMKTVNTSVKRAGPYLLGKNSVNSNFKICEVVLSQGVVLI